MQTIAEIRLDNLRRLVREKGSQDKVAEAAGTSAVYLSQLINQTADSRTKKPREIGNEMARKLEEGCEKERGWMDNQHRGSDPHSTQLSEAIAILEAMPAAELNQALKVLSALRTQR
jgi:hypothetical protein